MNAVSSDASVELQKEDNKERMKIGIFSCKHNDAIAKRLQTRIQLHCSNVIVYDQDYIPPGGTPRSDAPLEFIDQCHILLWLATDSSLSDGYMEHYRTLSQHEAIVSKQKCLVPLIPNEHLNITLPRALQAIQPLKENNKFEEQIKKTLAWFRRKHKLAPLQSVAETSDVIQDEAPSSTEAINYHIHGNIGNLVIGNASGVDFGNPSDAVETTHTLSQKSVNQVGTTESDSNSYSAGDSVNSHISREPVGQKDVTTTSSNITDVTEPLRSGMKQPEQPAPAERFEPAILR